jgi:hypothetical protein
VGRGDAKGGGKFNINRPRVWGNQKEIRRERARGKNFSVRLFLTCWTVYCAHPIYDFYMSSEFFNERKRALIEKGGWGGNSDQ